MKTYNTIVILVVCAMVGICAGIVLWAQPINGDLTRIGAHPERWYGWNAPQQRIPDITNTSRDHAKKHILVVGDSFSAIGHWQAFLTDKYSFSFVHAQNTNIHAFLQRVHSEKPDAVVVESVERFALAMFGPESQFMGNFAKKCQTETVGNMSPEIITRNVVGSNASPITYPTYTRKIFPTSAKEISQGLFYLKQWLWFKVKPRKQATSILDLTHHHLFSNLRNYQLLVVNSDLLLLPDFAAPLINASHCAMRSIANELTNSGVAYAMLVIPDKTTAYQPYLANTQLRDRTPVVSRLLNSQAPPHSINMLPAIREALQQNAVDFYLPNDTHWGDKGFQLAAKMLDTELQSQWQAALP